MGDLLGLTGLGASDMLVLVLGLPYVFIAVGRLVPQRQVRDWRELYFSSEAARERAMTAMERGADALEATNKLVQATLAPIERRVNDDA